jgi:hypothetical protein
MDLISTAACAVKDCGTGLLVFIFRVKVQSRRPNAAVRGLFPEQHGWTFELVNLEAVADESEMIRTGGKIVARFYRCSKMIPAKFKRVWTLSAHLSKTLTYLPVVKLSRQVKEVD